ncbi:MAG TPA: DUF6338 family protein [Terriglobales bacterium]|nr:DUF6338 family protein [Terriglobales bacterium]
MAVPGVGEPAEHLVDFLVYVMPGFIALQFFRAKYPAKKLSEFLQVAWSLIYGVILAALIRSVDGRFLHGGLHSSAPGFPASRFVIALLLAGLFGGIILVGLYRARFFVAAHWPRWEGIAPDPQSIWAKVNRPTNDYAVVYVDDGSIYFGWIKDFTFDPDAQDNDFLLADAKRVDEQLTEKYSITGQGVYLNTRNVKRIEFL